MILCTLKLNKRKYVFKLYNLNNKKLRVDRANVVSKLLDIPTNITINFKNCLFVISAQYFVVKA